MMKHVENTPSEQRKNCEKKKNATSSFSVKIYKLKVQNLHQMCLYTNEISHLFDEVGREYDISKK